MKKKYFIILLLFSICSNAQIINISDINLKIKLLQANINTPIAYDANYNQIKIDINSNNEIEINEALLVYALNVSNSSINNLNGLEYFSNLINLNCNSNNITSFNFTLFPNLLYFNGNNNLFSSLSINNNNTIDTIQLNNNNLTSVSVSNCNNLWELNCSNNTITNINIQNLPTLYTLNFANNLLTNVNISNFPNLNYLYFDYNLLTTFTFTNCPNTKQFQCSNNLLTTLDLSNLNLLQRVHCFDNDLAAINLSGCSSLTQLYCANNNLTSIDCSSCSSLDILDCQNNQLSYLNVKNGIHETSYGICGNPNLNYICVDNNPAEINHMTNQVGNLYCNYSNVIINPNCLMNIDSFDLTSNFEIFPNPIQNTLNIHTNSTTLIRSLKIYNNIGQVVFSQIIDNKGNNFQLDALLLSPGIYFAFIDSDKGLATKKFIKN